MSATENNAQRPFSGPILPSYDEDQAGITAYDSENDFVTPFSVDDQAQTRISTMDAEHGIDVTSKISWTICHKTFSRHYCLMRHYRTVHPLSGLTDLVIKDEKKKNHRCDICEKLFLKPAHVLRHKRTVHHLNEISENKAQKYTVSEKNVCSICNKVFTNVHSLKRHEKNVNSIIPQYQRKYQCSECLNNYPSSKVSFVEHFKEQHPDLAIEKKEMTFQSEEEFSQWKSSMEKATSSFYFLKHKYEIATFKVLQHYQCHRSGSYKSKGLNKRHEKIQGSNKIGFFCPSHIVKEQSKLNSCIKVIFISTHVGHQCDPGRIRLAEEEKKEIAAQLQTGVSPQRILLNISERATLKNRYSATKVQDIRNIAASYGVNMAIQRDQSDLISVDSWVREMMSNENSPILLYKLPGEHKEEFPAVKDEDFLRLF